MISNELLKEKIILKATSGNLIENNEFLIRQNYKEIECHRFNLPQNWIWTTLEEIVDYKNGFAFNSAMMSKNNNGIPVIKSANIGKKKVIIDSKTDYIENPTEKMLRCIINKNDILMVLSSQSSNVQPLGISAIYKLETPALLNQRVLKLSARENINSDYLLYVINSTWFHDKLSNKAAGLAQANLKLDHVLNMEVPLPPLEEQEKIVKKIEKLFELIDKKEKNDKEKDKLRTLLKEKILDSAIHGELVEQNESESNSIEYIKNIQKLKENLILKKELKRDSKINCNKPQIVLPRGWNWVRLGDLGIYKKGPFGSSLTKDMFVADSPNSYKVYEQKNAIQKDWKLGNYFITKEKYDSMKSFIIKPNDIIVSCAGTIGEIYVIPQNARAGIINQALMKITLFDNSIMDFYIMYFDHVLKYESRKKGKGTAIRNIPPFDVLKNIYVPLPPIEEQHRIMNKIEECFKLIEQL